MMETSVRVARVYAEAMLAIGREQELMERIHDDLKDLAKLYDEDPKFRSFFTSPRFDRVEKARIARKIFTGQVCEPVLGLLLLLVRKGRETVLDNIYDQFVRYRDEAEGRAHVWLRSAKPLLPEDVEAFRARIAAASGRTVVMHEILEPELIGGVVVRVNDFVLDGSIRRRLKALRKNLLTKERLFD
jgi:F-type H+-transporting ATPase subunit delta